MLRTKAPLTHKATIASVERLLEQAINERMARIDMRRRWVDRVRVAMVIGAAVAAGLMAGKL